MPADKLLAQLVQLFESRRRELFVAALSITRDRGSAEDAVLDALLAVSELQHRPDDLLSYVYRTVRNKALHSVKQSRRFSFESDYSQFIDQQSQSAEQQVFLRQLMSHLESLEGNQQQVLIMKLFGDLTFDEIARITDNSPNTVASWYRRGLKKLKESIHEPAL